LYVIVNDGAKYSLSILKFEIVNGFAKSGYDIDGLGKVGIALLKLIMMCLCIVLKTSPTIADVARLE